MDEKHVTRNKSFGFAVRIVRLAQYLQREHREFVLSKQILKSGTSIGANVEEASAAQSRNDFVSKMAIASKEARETKYGLRLLEAGDYLDANAARSLSDDCNELICLLTAIVQTTKGR